MATEAVRKFSRRTPDDAVLTRLFENARYVPGTFDQTRPVRRRSSRPCRPSTRRPTSA